jgi:hypothetical protein
MAQCYNLDLHGTTFTYRGPSRNELKYAETSANGNIFVYYENLINTCVISPQVTFGPSSSGLNLDDLPFLPGDVSLLARSIEYASGFRGIEFTAYLRDQAAEYIESDEGKLDTLSVIAMPGLNPISLYDLDPPILFRLYAMARTIAPIMGVDERIVLSPEEWLKEQQVAEKKRMIAEKQAEAMARMGQATRLNNSFVEEQNSFFMDK